VQAPVSGGGAELEAQFHALAGHFHAEAEAMAERTAADAEAARSEARLLRASLEGAAAAAAAIRTEMESRLRVAAEARDIAAAVDTEANARRDAEARRQRRRDIELKREVEVQMSQFAERTAARLGDVQALCAEIDGVGAAMEAAAREEAAVLHIELEQMTLAIRDAQAKTAAHFMTATQAQRLVRQQLQQALQAQQAVAHAEAAKREQLQAHVEGLKAELLAIASMADAGAPPGVSDLTSCVAPLLRCGASLAGGHRPELGSL
jgi:hypothetical protein